MMIVRAIKSPRPSLPSAPAIVTYLALAKLAVHLATATNYGLFVDELYFLACGQHLAWGYVDLPPLAAALAWLARALFGHSVFGIHLIPALAGAGLVALTGLLVHELGGKRFAQLLAGLAILVASVYLTVHSYLSMNAIEPLIWTGCACLLVRMIKTGDARLWLAFGALSGLGLLNKATMAMFGLGLVLGLLLTPARKLMASRWFLFGGAIAALIFLPNLIWMIRHGFPMLELLANIRRSGRNVSLTPLQFILEQAVLMHPLTLPLWLAGLGAYFFGRQLKAYRVLGWAYLVVLGVLLATEGRTYYLAPVYPILFAGGAVGIEGWMDSVRWRSLRPAYAGALAIGGTILAPLFLPVLPPEVYTRYADALHIQQLKIETFATGKLPQLFADRFGWPEMAETTAQAYHALPPEEQAVAAILTGNYGQAGAIDFYGPALGLPGAISGHQNYYYWGPRDYTGEIVIALGMSPTVLRTYFADVRPAGTVRHPYSMPYENLTIFVCRGPKQSLTDIWPNLKNWS
jgi:4-amino-4-deoxy-L-arabinose transferase-like glycosyltransferase